MKKTIFTLLGILALTLLPQLESRSSAGALTTAPLQSKEFRKTVEVQSGGDFSLETDKGSVRLTSWNNNQVEIYARIDAPENESADYGREAVEGARIDITGDSRALTVRSNFDGVPNKGNVLNQSKTLPHIHYEIRAPRNLNLHIEVDRSKLEVQGFNGKIRLQLDRSPLVASDLEGEVQVSIDRGSINFNNLRGSLKIDADRTSGEFRALQLSGDSSIEIDRGTFDLGLASSQGLSIIANLSKRSGFSSDFEVNRPLSSGKGRDRDNKSFEGTINGGGPKLAIESDRGTINLKRQ
jgi:hypothetical protein